MSTSLDIAAIRNDFPMLKQTMHGKPLIYLDSAATSQKPRSVIDTIHSCYSENYGTVHRAVYELVTCSTEAFQQARIKAQKFLNAKHSHEILFTRGTTESINMIAYSFGKAFIKPGDEVLISELEHHSNIVPWQILCEDRGATLKIIPATETGELDLKAFEEKLTHKTKLVAIAHIANSIGTLHPIEFIIEQAHKKGAKVLIDGAQAAPHLFVDVQALDCDFYAFSGHKALGPTGIGILYGKEELLNAMPPYQGGGDMILEVDFSHTTYNTLPLKFEAGTPMIVQAIGMGAALDYIETVGREKIAAHEHALLIRATEKLQGLEAVRIIGQAPEKGAIVSFVVEGVHPLDVGTLLDLQGIAVRTGHHCAQPTMRHFDVSATIRASFGLYNTLEEVDIFAAALKDILKTLK